DRDRRHRNRPARSYARSHGAADRPVAAGIRRTVSRAVGGAGGPGRVAVARRGRCRAWTIDGAAARLDACGRSRDPPAAASRAGSRARPARSIRETGGMMSIKPDHWIRKMCLEHRMIEPFEEKQVRAGVISYGVSSYGYDIRIADEFKIFTNVNSTIV